MRVDTALSPSASAGRLAWSIGSVRAGATSWRQVNPSRFETTIDSGLAVAVEFSLSTANTIQTKVWAGGAPWGYVFDTAHLPAALKDPVEGLVRALSSLPVAAPKPRRRPWDRLAH